MDINNDILMCIVEHFDYKQLIVSRTVSKMFHKLCDRRCLNKSQYDFINDFSVNVTIFHCIINVSDSLINHNNMHMHPKISTLNLYTFFHTNTLTKKKIMFSVNDNKIILYDTSKKCASNNASELINSLIEHDIIFINTDSGIPEEITLKEIKVNIEICIEVPIDCLYECIIDGYSIYGNINKNLDIHFYINDRDKYTGKRHIRSIGKYIISSDNCDIIILIYKYIMLMNKYYKI